MGWCISRQLRLECLDRRDDEAAESDSHVRCPLKIFGVGHWDGANEVRQAGYWKARCLWELAGLTQGIALHQWTPPRGYNGGIEFCFPSRTRCARLNTQQRFGEKGKKGAPRGGKGKGGAGAPAETAGEPQADQQWGETGYEQWDHQHGQQEDGHGGTDEHEQHAEAEAVQQREQGGPGNKGKGKKGKKGKKDKGKKGKEPGKGKGKKGKKGKGKKGKHNEPWWNA